MTFDIAREVARAGHSYRSLADEIGVPEHSLRRIRDGQGVHPKNARRIAAYFKEEREIDLDVTDLISAFRDDDEKAAA